MLLLTSIGHRRILVLFFNSFATEFIQGVSQFSVQGEKEKKLKCKCVKEQSNSMMDDRSMCVHLALLLLRPACMYMYVFTMYIAEIVCMHSISTS